MFAMSFSKECLLVWLTWKIIDLSQSKRKQTNKKPKTSIVNKQDRESANIYKRKVEEMENQNMVYSNQARNKGLPSVASNCLPGIHLPFCVL